MYFTFELATGKYRQYSGTCDTRNSDYQNFVYLDECVAIHNDPTVYDVETTC